MNRAQFVFKNKEGKVIRALQWVGNQGTVVLFTRSQRIELIECKSKPQVPYQVLAKVTKEQVKREDQVFLSRLKLCYVQDVIEVVPDVTSSQENDEQFKSVLRGTALAHFAVLLLVLLVGYFYEKPQIQETVITVMEQNRPEKQKTRTTRVAEKINRKLKVAKKKVSKNKKILAKSIRTTKSKKVSSRGSKVNSQLQEGVLGALAGLHAGTNNLKLGAVDGRKTRGVGSGKSGSHSRVSFGKGLVASQPGSGNEIGAIDGYKTRGQGGGQNGYGKIAVGGSGSIYSAPLQEEAFVEGGLDRSQIDAVVRRNIGQITYCYERGLQKDPQLTGRVAVNFIIAASGRVSMAKVQDSSLQSSSVESCIVGKLRQWKFPKPYGQVNVQVTYPFSLRRLGVNQISQRFL